MSVGRLQKFLTSDELHADRITVTDEPAKGTFKGDGRWDVEEWCATGPLYTDQEESISVTGGTFTWDSPERPVLSE